jgi:Putative oxalocrotonate tautomerase enzyme
MTLKLNPGDELGQPVVGCTVDETPFDLWTIQGIRPPRAETEDEKRWIVENRASPRTHA